MRLSKTKKIILSLVGLGVLTISIITPILIVNNDKKNNQIKRNNKPNINKLKVNIPSTATLKGSNITNGQDGIIFQDSFKNLWAMGQGSKLQVLKVNSQKDGYVEDWASHTNSDLTKNSNITNGLDGTIFQDSFKNLWTMGAGSKLQVLKVNSQKKGYVEGWINNNVGNSSDNLLKNSNITNGQDGTIFQDSFKNLWAMGNGTKLEVLKVNSQKNAYIEGWSSDNSSLTKNSNINNGEDGIIFQDSFGNLWAMGKGTKLQVLKANSQKDGYVKSWINDNRIKGDPLLKNSNIIYGEGGTIFQDEFKNLWTMGSGTKLQVLKANSQKDGYVEGWTSTTSSGLTKSSNINSGTFGTIFQDFFKNLWSMGNGTKLQVLKVNSQKDSYVKSWINDNSQSGDPLLKNSNITNGYNGTIFQDQFKNLWSMAGISNLQVLKVHSNNNEYVIEGWINDNLSSGNKLLKNSNINNGWFGTIFQDSFKNLWAMGSNQNLQVLKANKTKDVYVYVDSWINK